MEQYVDANPTAYDFGDVMVGQSVTAEFEIVSSILNPTLGGVLGSDASAFTLQQLRCSPQIFPHVCTWGLTFTPTHPGLSLALLSLPWSCMPLSGNGVTTAGLTLAPPVSQERDYRCPARTAVPASAAPSFSCSNIAGE